MVERPKDEQEMQKREAIGVIRASRFVRTYAHSHKPITIDTISEIHKCIFEHAWPEIAGKYRDENLEITDSKHLPPHHSQVHEYMKKAKDELIIRLKNLEKVEGLIIAKDVTEEVLDAIEKIIRTAAWLHHLITNVHPFREGNGRTARLAANLILERYGLVGISIKIEKENKDDYRNALAQIDQYQDYEPLEGLIYEGLIERYSGVEMKFYKVKK